MRLFTTIFALLFAAAAGCGEAPTATVESEPPSSIAVERPAVPDASKFPKTPPIPKSPTPPTKGVAQTPPPATTSVAAPTTAAAKPAVAVKQSPARPAWVDQPAGLYRGVYQTVVIVGPEPSREACESATSAAVRSKVQEYAANFSGGGPLEQFDLRDETLFPRVVGETWEERVQSDGAEVVFLHTQVRIDPQLQAQWRAAAAEYSSRDHTQTLIRAFLAAMWIVAVGHVLLRADERWEKHRGRFAAWLIAMVLIVLPFLA